MDRIEIHAEFARIIVAELDADPEWEIRWHQIGRLEAR